jgi:hypothetical protein
VLRAIAMLSSLPPFNNYPLPVYSFTVTGVWLGIPHVGALVPFRTFHLWGPPCSWMTTRRRHHRHCCSSLPVTSHTFLPSFLVPPFRFFGCGIMTLCSLFIIYFNLLCLSVGRQMTYQVHYRKHPTQWSLRLLRPARSRAPLQNQY